MSAAVRVVLTVHGKVLTDRLVDDMPEALALLAAMRDARYDWRVDIVDPDGVLPTLRIAPDV